ncbi:MAG: hypothetical protein JWM31_2436 [Solirubrobacterales bacterium]|nr:hypothetical protein [Solirubrobacterales bacterium]
MHSSVTAEGTGVGRSITWLETHPEREALRGLPPEVLLHDGLAEAVHAVHRETYVGDLCEVVMDVLHHGIEI